MRRRRPSEPAADRIVTFRRKFAAPVIVGALAALGHAPFGLWPVALLGFAALAWLVSISPRPMLTGWLGGVGYFAVTLHWIVEPFLVDVARHGWMAPFALVFISGGLALFWAGAGLLSARISGPRALIWALALALAELARGYVLTGFPWALPAYIWTDTPLRISAGFWGSYGLSALTLVLTALPAMATRWSMRAAGVVAAALGFLATGGAALWYAGPPAEPGKGVVRLVQPNAPQNEKWDPDKARDFVERQIAYTAAPKSGVDLIVWPETAIPYRLDVSAPVFERIAGAAGGVPVVLGLNRVADGRFFNALVTIGPDGFPTEIYDKVRLVPFGEFIPMGQLARLIGLQSFAARDGYGFSPGARVRLIDTPLGRALPLICYEAIFPQHIRGVPERPGYMLQITNDAWFGTFSGPFQHLQQAQFRAAEQGLPLIRAANTGVSAVIDANGRIVKSLALGVAGYLDVPMPGARAPTFYARTGDWPVGVIILVTLGALFFARKRNRVAKPPTSS
jgi:apolipoprotein N-acyltransferase